MTTIAQQQYDELRKQPTGRPTAQLADQARQMASREVGLAALAKMSDASYWLGLISTTGRLRKRAWIYLTRRTLEAFPKGNPWVTGAGYNIGRTYEALGQRDKALEQYRRSTDPGQQLRALHGWRVLSQEGGPPASMRIRSPAASVAPLSPVPAP